MMGWQWHKRTICKSFAPRSIQITTSVPHHSVFTGRMPFLPPNQQCQSNKSCLCIHVSMYTVMSMYTGAKTVVRTVYGNSSGFEVKVGMHQGSALT